MTTSAATLLREGRAGEVWQRYCGYFDLTIDEFMHIQNRLLTEQIELLHGCELGRRLLGGHKPESVEEFRRNVPVTTYHDYLPWLKERREDVLPAKPVAWVRTSGRTGEFACKWSPVSKPLYDIMGRSFLATQIVSSARYKGDVRIEEGDIYLYTVAPPPFISGQVLRAAREEFPFHFVPGVEEAEAMDFQARMEKAFEMALETGVDYFLGIASVLVTMGEAFSKRSGSMKLSRDVLRPATISRLGKALVKSRLQGEPLQPKHIWNPKGITTGGMDVQIYRKRIEALWGVKVLEGYGSTEFGNIGTQTWGARSTGIIPTVDCAFWEFMPEPEYAKWRNDRSYRPATLLTNEVRPGRYVLVGTSLLGGAFVRYVLGDLIRVISTRDVDLGIDLPQIVVESRADDLINLGSLVWITERSLWQAFGALDLHMTEWVARKETTAQNEPVLHLYLENGHYPEGELADAIHDALTETIEDYKTYGQFMRHNPVRVTTLAPETFKGYMLAKQAEGAELAHLKPPRMSPNDSVVQRLLQISRGDDLGPAHGNGVKP
jgi:hypothetical protein